MANAVTISGDATNACVLGLPSARFAKFLLKEVNDGISFLFFSTYAFPHTNAGTAGICKYHSTDLVKCIKESISFNGISNLFTDPG